MSSDRPKGAGGGLTWACHVVNKIIPLIALSGMITMSRRENIPYV